MKRGIFAVAVIFLFLAVNAQAVKKQVFVGGGGVVAWSDGKTTLPVAGGAALVVPISQKLFLRPAIGGGVVLPVIGTPSPILQAVLLVGYKATKRTSLLVGGGINFLFPSEKPTVVLPTALLSSATRVKGGWAIFTPIAFTKRGIGVSLQLGYTR